MRVLLPLEYRN